MSKTNLVHLGVVRLSVLLGLLEIVVLAAEQHAVLLALGALLLVLPLQTLVAGARCLELLLQLRNLRLERLDLALSAALSRKGKRPPNARAVRW